MFYVLDSEELVFSSFNLLVKWLYKLLKRYRYGNLEVRKTVL